MDGLPFAVRRPASRGLLVVAAVAAVIAAAGILFLDRPIAIWIARYKPLSIWDAGIDGVEVVTGYPITRWFTTWVLMTIMVATLAIRPWRRLAPGAIFIAGTHIIGKYVTNEIKDLTSRIRPGEWLRYRKHYPNIETFGVFDGNSFTSGHVAIFATLLVPLMILFPRARVFHVIACAILAFVMAARMAVGAHWLSDVAGGISVVCVVTYLIGLGIRPSPPR